jgi:Stress responsive A/B Barrel Domain
MNNNVFVHHVFFWLVNPESEADKKSLIAGLEKLSKVEEIKFSHIGLPAATNREVIDTTYSVSWLLFFYTPEAQDIYQTHPVHLQFVAECKHLWEKVIVYDSVRI